MGGGDGVSTGLRCCCGGGGGGQWPVRTCREQMTPTGDPGAITGGLPAASAGAAGPWGPCAGQGAARAHLPPQAPGRWVGGSKEPPQLSAPRRAD